MINIEIMKNSIVILYFKTIKIEKIHKKIVILERIFKKILFSKALGLYSKSTP